MKRWLSSIRSFYLLVWKKQQYEPYIEQELKNFGDRLRILRKAKGYTNHENFAFENNINRVQYGRYEKGGNIKLATLIRVLKGLDISLKDFFRRRFLVTHSTSRAGEKKKDQR